MSAYLMCSLAVLTLRSPCLPSMPTYTHCYHGARQYNFKSYSILTLVALFFFRTRKTNFNGLAIFARSMGMRIAHSRCGIIFHEPYHRSNVDILFITSGSPCPQCDCAASKWLYKYSPLMVKCIKLFICPIYIYVFWLSLPLSSSMQRMRKHSRKYHFSFHLSP